MWDVWTTSHNGTIEQYKASPLTSLNLKLQSHDTLESVMTQHEDFPKSQHTAHYVYYVWVFTGIANEHTRQSFPTQHQRFSKRRQWQDALLFSPGAGSVQREPSSAPLQYLVQIAPFLRSKFPSDQFCASIAAVCRLPFSFPNGPNLEGLVWPPSPPSTPTPQCAQTHT